MVMSVSAALRYAKDKLNGISSEQQLEAKLIVAHLIGVEPNKLALSDKTLNHQDIDQIINRRKEGEPLQYIFGKWWFYKSEFLVGKGVLIPRQDTELLVEEALNLIKDKKAPKVCDLCSGSGCIAISIAKDRPDAYVLAVEKYSEAYAWLLKNIEKNGAKNVTPQLADALVSNGEQFDLIVSNPPYIPTVEKETLSKEVLNEPHTALFGGEDGLYFYREISRVWKNSLNKGGYLAFEVGIKEADLVAQILTDNGYKNIGIKNDLLGVQRVVFGTPDNVKYNQINIKGGKNYVRR